MLYVTLQLNRAKASLPPMLEKDFLDEDEV